MDWMVRSLVGGLGVTTGCENKRYGLARFSYLIITLLFFFTACCSKKLAGR